MNAFLENTKLRLWNIQNIYRSYHFGLASLKKVECNMCGWTGAKFLDFYTGFGHVYKNSVCPKCDSHPRHRAYYLYLEKVFSGFDRLIKVLHFAPEKSIAEFIQSRPMLII